MTEAWIGRALLRVAVSLKRGKRSSNVELFLFFLGV